MGIITISRQIGAGETNVSADVARQLGWELVDHVLLDRQVAEMGVKLPEVLHHDERAPGLLESWTHPQEARQYFETLSRIMTDYSNRGDVVVVGRGGNFFLKDADALHFRLTADMAFRIRRVMEIRWLSEGPARELILQNDHDRASFFRHYFKADWSDPQYYHAVFNTSHVGIPGVVNQILAATRYRWPS